MVTTSLFVMNITSSKLTLVNFWMLIIIFPNSALHCPFFLRYTHMIILLLCSNFRPNPDPKPDTVLVCFGEASPA